MMFLWLAGSTATHGRCLAPRHVNTSPTRPLTQAHLSLSLCSLSLSRLSLFPRDLESSPPIFSLYPPDPDRRVSTQRAGAAGRWRAPPLMGAARWGRHSPTAAPRGG